MDHLEQASQEGQEIAEEGEGQDFGDVMQKWLQLCHNAVKRMSFATTEWCWACSCSLSCSGVEGGLNFT